MIALETVVLKADNNGNFLFVDKTDSTTGDSGVHFSLMDKEGKLLLKDDLDFDFETFIECVLKLGYQRFGNRD